MYKYIYLLSALTVCCISYELESVAGTALEQCIKCICYARTGTSDTHLCGRELLTFGYWKTAGSLTTSSNLKPEFAWSSCREEENCILNTIIRYTGQYGASDLNLDGKFNCQERFGIQIWEKICDNRQIALGYFDRFYSCPPNVIESEVRVGDNQNVGANHKIAQRSNQNERNYYNRNGSDENQNGGGNNENPRKYEHNKAQDIHDQVLLVEQNINGYNLNIQQNVGFIGSHRSHGDGFEEDFTFGRNPNGDRNNQNTDVINLNVHQNGGFIGSHRSQGDAFEDDLPFGRNPNGAGGGNNQNTDGIHLNLENGKFIGSHRLQGGNNQNRGENNYNGDGNVQSISKTTRTEDNLFQQTVIGYDNKVDRNLELVASQTSRSNAKQGVQEVPVQQHPYRFN